MVNTDGMGWRRHAWSDYENDGDMDVIIAQHGNDNNSFYGKGKGQC